MPVDAFSEAWAAAWGQALNASERYRQATATWEGSVVLRQADDGRGVFLDLWHGGCRGARLALAADGEAAAYVLEATRADWREFMTGRLAPIHALMTGKLRLAKGDLTSLVPYAAAAGALIGIAGTIETSFPE